MKTANGASHAAQKRIADDLIGEFKQLCEKGECAWTRKSGSKTAIYLEFEKLAARGATVATLRKAVPIAQRKFEHNGNRPGPKSVLNVMRTIMHVDASTDF